MMSASLLCYAACVCDTTLVSSSYPAFFYSSRSHTRGAQTKYTRAPSPQMIYDLFTDSRLFRSESSAEKQFVGRLLLLLPYYTADIFLSAVAELLCDIYVCAFSPLKYIISKIIL